MKKILSFAVLAVLSLFTHKALATVLGAPVTCVGDFQWYVDSAGTPGGTWSTSNTAIATIGATDGVLLGHSAGTVTVSYTAGSNIGTLVVSVNPRPTPIIGGPTTICPGTSITLSDAVPGGTWISSNIAVATAGATTGVVMGIATGTSVIEYNMGGCGYTFLITVGPPPPDTATGPSGVCPGSSITLSTIATGGTWSSSNSAVATVGATTGVVNGITTGTAAISYSVPTACGTGSSIRVISVSTTTDPGTISPYVTMHSGSSMMLTATVSGGAWSSSNSSIATVSTAGLVTGVSYGTCTISYAVTGCSGVAYATTIATVSFPASVGNVSASDSWISSYPNPVSNELNVNWSLLGTEQGNVVITDMSGREVLRATIVLNAGTGKSTFNLLPFPNGLYIISVKTRSINYNNKILVQK